MGIHEVYFFLSYGLSFSWGKPNNLLDRFCEIHVQNLGPIEAVKLSKATYAYDTPIYEKNCNSNITFVTIILFDAKNRFHSRRRTNDGRLLEEQVIWCENGADTIVDVKVVRFCPSI